MLIGDCMAIYILAKPCFLELQTLSLHGNRNWDMQQQQSLCGLQGYALCNHSGQPLQQRGRSIRDTVHSVWSHLYSVHGAKMPHAMISPKLGHNSFLALICHSNGKHCYLSLINLLEPLCIGACMWDDIYYNHAQWTNGYLNRCPSCDLAPLSS